MAYSVSIIEVSECAFSTIGVWACSVGSISSWACSEGSIIVRHTYVVGQRSDVRVDFKPTNTEVVTMLSRLVNCLDMLLLGNALGQA